MTQAYRGAMRLRHLHPDDLDAEQRALYETLTTGPRQQAHGDLDPALRLTDTEGRLQGPFNAFLVHPRLGMALQEISRLLRFEGLLGDRAREIVILVVAASQRSSFEWAAHEAIARSVGVTDAEIAALAREEPIAFSDSAEDAAARLARSLVSTGDVDDMLYAQAQAALGDAGLFEVTTMVGIYRLVATQLATFQIAAPPGPWDDASPVAPE